MEYEGKLYGKIGDEYFDTGKTAKDWDELNEQADRCSCECMGYTATPEDIQSVFPGSKIHIALFTSDNEKETK